MSGHRTQGGARKRATTRASERPHASRPLPRHDADLNRFTDPVPDALVLAAVHRADLQWIRPNEGAAMSQIANHLGYQRSPWTTRNLRPQLEQLASEGLLDETRVRSIRRWAINRAGTGCLIAARRREPLELPESPQHRQWRRAREQAANRIEEMRALFDDALTQGARLLDQDTPASQDVLILADRLKQTCWQFGSALYCLNEWREPDERVADHETHPMGSVEQGRRNTRSWMDHDELSEREARRRKGSDTT